MVWCPLCLFFLVETHWSLSKWNVGFYTWINCDWTFLVRGFKQALWTWWYLVHVFHNKKMNSGIQKLNVCCICTDIDECKEKKACQCPQCSCKNTWGSYNCSCGGDLLYIKDHDACISELNAINISTHVHLHAIVLYLYLFSCLLLDNLQVKLPVRENPLGLLFGSFWLAWVWLLVGVSLCTNIE